MTKTNGRGRRPKAGVDSLKIKDDYLDTTITVVQLCESHGIDPHKMYRELDALGVPRRESPEFEAYALKEVKGG